MIYVVKIKALCKDSCVIHGVKHKRKIKFDVSKWSCTLCMFDLIANCKMRKLDWKDKIRWWFFIICTDQMMVPCASRLLIRVGFGEISSKHNGRLKSSFHLLYEVALLQGCFWKW